ncbi:hypothetical protein MP228_001720 [Amoeboaphelidium protococcarum]|nr:hypothetical protein MP228_001720 [Amoeboaphelidium protococcarum]
MTAYTDPSLKIGMESLRINDEQSARVNDDFNQSSIHAESERDYQVQSQSFDQDSAVASATSCSYCHISDPPSVVKCMVCNKWFCNARTGTSASHIIHHLVKSRHKQVHLHPDSALGDIVPECYKCGCKNVFLLGFIPAKADTVVVIFCRQPCASISASKDMEWDLSQWQALIDDRSFLSWLVRVPSGQDVSRSRRLTATQMNMLEELWRDGQVNADVDDLDRVDVQDDIAPVQLKYQDAYQFQNVYTPLVLLEAEYDRSVKEQQTQDEVTVRWEQGLNMKWTASFYLANYLEGEVRLTLGDEVRLKYNGGVCRAWSAVGNIVKLPNSHTNEISVECRRPDVNINCTIFSIEIVWNSATFDRQVAALRKFAVDASCVSPYLYNRLLGHEVQAQTLKVNIPRNLAVPGLGDLNHSQAFAIKSAMQRPLCLIQGPFGTGKTMTAAALVYHLNKNLKQNEGGGQILVCAPSNVAVDQMAEQIHKTGLKIVRLAARNRENIESNVDFLTLHSQVRNLEADTELHRLWKLKEQQGELTRKDEETLKRLVRKNEKMFLAAADVVCTTCIGAADPRLKDLKFKTVLIDEAGQATEPEALVSIVNGCKQLILVGDHQQLGPVVINKKAARAGFTRSLFERMVLLGVRPIRLQVQYRMHPCLSEFPSNLFYEGSLQNGVSADQRIRKDIDFPWPNKAIPMMFHVNIGQEETASTGTSFLNRTEAANVEKIVTKFLRCGVKPHQIGVITPYEGQRGFVVQYMKMSGNMPRDLYEQIEVASVDAFQGREKDYIILTCVRSNSHQGIGFLNDPRRLNVALTRAKFGMVILGNPRVLGRHTMWHQLLTHFKQQKVLVEGPLGNLRQSFIQLPAPRIVANNKDSVDGKENGQQQQQQRQYVDYFNLTAGTSTDGMKGDVMSIGSQYSIPNSQDLSLNLNSAGIVGGGGNNLFSFSTMNSQLQSQDGIMLSQGTGVNLSQLTVTSTTQNNNITSKVGGGNLNFRYANSGDDEESDGYATQFSQLSGYTEY